jgi:hypothetical protein
MLDTALLAVLAAPLIALPAELVTRDRPCCALPAASEAPSLAFDAVEAAALLASEVVEAARRCSIHLDCCSACRGTNLADIVDRTSGGGAFNGLGELLELAAKSFEQRRQGPEISGAKGAEFGLTKAEIHFRPRVCRYHTVWIRSNF